METTTSPITQQERFQRAVRAIRKHGVTTRQNVRKCCRSCYAYDLGVEGLVPYAFTYGSQSSAYAWKGDRPVYVDPAGRGAASELMDKIYWNFDDAPTGRIIAEEFAREGFRVEWNGTAGQCVMIAFGEE